MILVVAATARELEFVAGAETLVCGIGPVESALATAGALAGERAPTCVLHIGIAGAQTLEPPALVLGSEAVYADALDATLGRSRASTGSSRTRCLPRRARPSRTRTCSRSRRRAGRRGGVCEVEAMEGFGVLRAAALAGVPALELRAVSNAVGEPDRARWRIDDALALLAEPPDADRSASMPELPPPLPPRRGPSVR